MADAYAAKPRGEDKPKKLSDTEAGEICRTALDRYRRWTEREQENTAAAYDDLEFCFVDGAQWPSDVAAERRDEGRPMLTVNRLPQFVHQVTGDMRQMKPAIKVVPVDNRGDKKTAETIAGMVRYVENRSDAPGIYTQGADLQVACGIGAWQVIKEYAEDTTFNQELRIVGVDDAIAIAFDPDAVLPTREDMMWCLVPTDFSHEVFKEKWPDCPLSDFDDAIGTNTTGWFDSNFIRVAAYWVKKPLKRTLALMPNGSIIDLTNDEEAKKAEYALQGARIEKRDSFEVCRYLITAQHVLEGPIEWPGMYIPIIPAIGEEVRIGKKVVRRGLVRTAKDAQRIVNYFFTAHTEITGLQPKSPWLVTEKNVEKYQEQWSTANRKNWPYLVWEPDQKNGFAQPSRVQPSVSSQGVTEGLMLAVENMKACIGIYDASLGAKSNETSGKAIIARQREGDTGSFLYIDNWSRAIRHTGKILIDLIPHVYDTERMIRIEGEDGKVDLAWINKAVGIEVMGPDGQMIQTKQVENDVTVGAYDVVLEVGPSYSTKRAEARESMTEFVRSAPQVAPVALDLIAKAQDWPMADEFAKRLEAIAPPAIQKMIAKDKGPDEQEPPEQPTPQEQMAAQAAQLQLADAQAEVEGKQIANAKAAQELQMGGGDPVAMVKAQSEQQRMVLDRQKAEMEMAAAQQKMQIDLQIAQVELEIKLADLAIKKAGLELDTAKAAMGLQRDQASMAMDAERHSQTLTQDLEKHGAGMEMMKAKAAQRPRADA